MNQKQTIALIAMFAAIIGVFLIPNVALAKKSHHHSSEDDGSISSPHPRLVLLDQIVILIAQLVYPQHTVPFMV